MLHANESATVGLGFNIGVQQIYCDIPTTGIGPAGEGVARYAFNPRVAARLGFGFGQLTDGLVKRTFTTHTANIDLQALIRIWRYNKTRVYVSAGLGALRHTYKRTAEWAIGDPNLHGQNFWSPAYIAGGALDLDLNDSWTSTFAIDYRYTPSDKLDGAERGASNDSYWNVRFGLIYHLPLKRTQISDLLADEFTDNEIKATENRIVELRQKIDRLSEKLSEQTARLNALKEQQDQRQAAAKERAAEPQQPIKPETTAPPMANAEPTEATPEKVKNRAFTQNFVRYAKWTFLTLGAVSSGLAVHYHQKANDTYALYESANNREDVVRLYNETIDFDKRRNTMIIAAAVNFGLSTFFFVKDQKNQSPIVLLYSPFSEHKLSVKLRYNF